MDSTFIYSRFVIGNQFFSRKQDCIALTNLLVHCENVAIIGPPKSGKMSLIQQALFNIRNSGRTILTAELNMLNIRDTENFLLRFGRAVIRAFGTTPDDYHNIVKHYLSGTHFVFNSSRYSQFDEILSSNLELDNTDMEAIIRLPYLIARDTECQLYIILEEFQNIAEMDGYERIIKAMENAMKEAIGNIEGPKCSFVIEGSRVNAMRGLFFRARNFHRCVVHFEMTEPQKKEIEEHVSKGLLSNGKVMDKELIKGICDIFRNNIWYINRIMSICDYLSKGYITEATVTEAMGMLLSSHEPAFNRIVSELTTFQLGLLRAIIDGNTKFSGSDVVRRYGLNSSANVKRLKEALCKKEIIVFNDNDAPQIIDPLFDYWLKNYYFK